MPNDQNTPSQKLKKEQLPRTPMRENDPAERVKGFMEVPKGYSEDEAVVEAGRCLVCKKPKCVAGCPVGIDIPAFVAQIRDGNFQRAAEILHDSNALPAICGRVCPQEEQCEVLCIEGIKHDPIAIGNLEKFVADWERANGGTPIPEIAPATGYKVGVVGSGPAGLTVAGDLVKLGHDVTIFEALHRPAGVLAYGIPEFRLPRLIVNSEVNYIQKLGVKFRFDVIIGVTITIDELFEQGYHAVFIGTGAGLPKMMNVPGENYAGVYSANEFLTRVNLMGAATFPKNDTPIRDSKHTVVVGGGNTAMDSARVARRVSKAKVTLVYRRSQDELPARREEVHHAMQEGIDFRLLNNPVAVLGNNSGEVTGIRIIKMELGEPGSDGRRKPVEVPGSEWEMECDTVIVAIGNAPNPIIPRTTAGIEVTKWGTIVADPETGLTSRLGVYAGGDIVSGAATVIRAMGAGRKSATAIDAYLRTLPKPKL
jgi:glutamate synthase (NADPH/NADH) small chain